MRPNLSLESIVGALAVLGTGVIMAGCGGDDPKTPVNAKEVPGATDTKAAGDGHCGADKAHKTGEGTCKGGAAAGHCGAGTEHKAGEASCSADKKGSMNDAKPGDTTTTSAAKPADTTAAPATPATPAAPAATGTATPAATGTAKKPATPATPATPAKK